MHALAFALSLAFANAAPAAPVATNVVTLHEVVIVSHNAPKVWTCGEPRPLATDAASTVKNCEYR
jgi:hypothetical protein